MEITHLYSETSKFTEDGIRYSKIYKPQQNYNDFQNLSKQSSLMFKIKNAKKTIPTIPSANGDPSITDKRMQLIQNNDIINVPDRMINQENNNKSKQMTSNYPPTLLRNGSLRPRSGLSRNPAKTQTLKYEQSDQQKIQEKIRQKKMIKANLQRPSTSTGANQNGGIRYDKKQRLITRKGTLNSMNSISTNKFPKGSMGNNQYTQDTIQQSESNGYISNQKALDIMLAILDRQQQYLKLKMENQSQFSRIRQKLISNISIIVLKWYKILQDQLYNEVRCISSRNQSVSHQESPTSIQQLIRQQIKKLFLKENGLFTVQQRCSNQQSRLQWLIDSRLEKLENLLTVTSGSR